MNLRKIIRVSIAYGLYATGLLSLFARIRLHRKAVVIMYHRVLSDEEYARKLFMGGIAVRSRTFEKQMGFLGKNFHILSPEEFLRHMQKRIPFRSKSCLITFDDGWKDNFKNAFPVLKESKIPALIFLSSGFIGSLKRFWQERFIEALYSLRRQLGPAAGKEAQNLPAMKIEGVAEVVRSDEAAFHEKASLFVASQKKESASRIEEMINLLNQGVESDCGGNSDEDAFLRWQEVQEMAREGICFGSHGVNHRILPMLAGEEIEKEISDSKEIIEKSLGTGVRTFSYPNGDYNEEVLKKVKKAGYEMGFTTENGPVATEDDPYTVRRVNIHEDMTDSTPMFLARVGGLW